jgi:hypothetical protein
MIHHSNNSKASQFILKLQWLYFSKKKKKKFFFYDLLHVEILINYVKIKLKFIVLYISPARPGTILSVVREITCIKKNIKKHN